MKIVNNINKYIFRGYDIRGKVPSDINEDVAYTIGKSYGSYIRNLGLHKCVVGHDNRLSSDSLSKSLIEGIIETGVDVINIGLVTTPMYYYACIKYEIPSGMMITASHNPKDENGFKFSFDKRGNACGKMIEDFYDFTMKKDFLIGKGSYTEKRIQEDYLALMKQSIDLGTKKVKVVLDPGNGATTTIVEDIFNQFDIDYTIINGENDGNFPAHHPDPLVEENLSQLKEAVIKNKADLGIAFDGDGDRVGVVDEFGNMIKIDHYMIIILRDIMPKMIEKKALYDVKCSKALEDEIIKLGGKPVCYRTGNSYIKAKVKEDNFSFGGELSGHVFFNDRFPGFDSGIYAGLRLIEILSRSTKSLSNLLEGINKYYISPELKFASPDNKKNEVVEKIKKYCQDKGYKLLLVDGVKALFEDGWAIVRVSNTGPNITARMEAKSEERLNEIMEEFESLIEIYNN